MFASFCSRRIVKLTFALEREKENISAYVNELGPEYVDALKATYKYETWKLRIEGIGFMIDFWRSIREL